jgi:WD40 repeat protein
MCRWTLCRGTVPCDCISDRSNPRFRTGRIRAGDHACPLLRAQARGISLSAHSATRAEQETVDTPRFLTALYRVVDANQYVLSVDPSLLIQQVHNALAADWDDTTPCGRRLREAARTYGRPWLRLLGRASGSVDPALRRVIPATGTVVSVAVSRGGLVAAGTLDDVVHLWDLMTGRLLAELEGHRAWVRAVAISDDGHLLASGGSDHTVRMWALPAGVLLRVLEGHGGEVSAVGFSPDGRILASGDRARALRLWNLPDGVLRCTLPQDADVTAVAFSPRDLALAVGDGGGKVTLWDSRATEVIWRGDAHHAIRCIAFSPDGDRLASGGYDDAVTIWNVSTGSPERTLGRREGTDASDWSKRTYAQSLAFSPDGQTLAVGNECWMESIEVRLWDTATWKQYRTFKGHMFHVSLDFSADGTLLITGGGGEVKVWDLRAPESKQDSTGHLDSIGPVAVSADGELLASGSGDQDSEWKSQDSSVLVWDAHTGNLNRTLAGHREAVIAVAFAPDESATLVSAGYDGVVKLWNANEGTCLRTSTTWAECSYRRVSNDCRTLAVGTSEKSVQLWNLVLDEDCRILTGHEGWVASLAFAPSDEALASGSADGTVRVWDLATGELKRTLAGHDGGVAVVQFGPGGRTLASFGGRTLMLSDVDSGTAVWTRQQWRRVLRLLFSPDGRWLAAGSYDGTVRLLDSDTGRLLAWLPGSSQVLALWFDPALPRLRVVERSWDRHAPNPYLVELVQPASLTGNNSAAAASGKSSRSSPMR